MHAPVVRSLPVSSLPCSSVVLVMGQDMPNIDLLPIEMNGRNQAVFVPTNIEDDQIADHIRAGKHLMEIVKTGKVIGLHDPEPRIERGLAVGMVLREGVQGFT